MVEHAGGAVVTQKLVQIIAIVRVVRFGHPVCQRVKRWQPRDFYSGDRGGALTLLQFGVQRPQHGFAIVVAGPAAFLAESVPLHVGLVHRADVIEGDAISLVGAGAKMLQGVYQVAGDLALEAGLQVGRVGSPLAVRDAGASHASRRAVYKGQKLWDRTGLSRTEEPALRGLPGPVVFPFGDFKGFRRSPGVVDLIRDAAADVEPPTGKPDAAGLRK